MRNKEKLFRAVNAFFAVFLLSIGLGHIFCNHRPVIRHQIMSWCNKCAALYWKSGNPNFLWIQCSILEPSPAQLWGLYVHWTVLEKSVVNSHHLWLTAFAQLLSIQQMFMEHSLCARHHARYLIDAQKPQTWFLISGSFWLCEEDGLIHE